MFEPRQGERVSGPSGFQDLLRPFVLRAALLDGRRFEAGERFSIGVNIFDRELPALDYFSQAFERLGVDGLGPGRVRVQLEESVECPAVEVDLISPRHSADRVTLAFLTPTELKIGGETLREPRFGALIRRARDRVAGLIRLYQPRADLQDIDFRGLGERSDSIRMTGERIEQHDYRRRSTRTGQVHGLGGFTGEADYEGDLTEFLPWIEALRWTGVGRLTIWGNGVVHVLTPDS